MKQTVRLRRVETLEIEIEVLQPLTRQTLAELFNQPRLLGAGCGKTLVSKVSDYEILGASPSCECHQPAVKKRKGR